MTRGSSCGYPAVSLRGALVLIGILALAVSPAAAQGTPEAPAMPVPMEEAPGAPSDRAALPSGPSRSEPAAAVKPFGLEFFAGAPTAFTVAPDASVPSDYRLDKGDKVRVRYWTPVIPEVSHELVVTATGVIPVPEIGDVPAAGLTLQEVRERLRSRLREQLRDPSFAADLVETRTISVYVTGAARRPGRYSVNAVANLLNVLYAAGGPAPDGTLRKVTLRRRNEVVAVMDVYRFLLEGVADTDVVLRDQDTVFLPRAGARVTVQGQVASPAIYEVLDGTTVADVVSLAGGLTASAYSRILRLQRIEKGERVERTLNAEAVLSNPRHRDNLVLRGGDVITVEDVSERVGQQVRIRGNVVFAGSYSTQRTPTVRRLLTEAQVRTGSHWERADLLRVLDDGTPVVVPVPLKSLLDGQATDIMLRDQDEVIVYENDEKAIIPLVSVEGAVKHPAAFRLAEGMRVSDLLFAAGGVMRDASPEVAHLYRRTGPNDFQILRVSPSQALQAGGAANPRLQDEDRLVIYRQEDVEFRANRVQVVGEVQRPGEFQAFAGLTLYDLLLQAGGPTEMACGTVEVATPAAGGAAQEQVEHPTRRKPDASWGPRSEQVAVQTYDLAAVRSGKHRDVPVTSGMLVSLPRRASKRTDPPRVELKGEVRRPGTYALLHEGELLASVVERAGGLTDYSDPFGVSLTRRKEQMLSKATSEQIQTVLSTMDQLTPPVSRSSDGSSDLRINVANAGPPFAAWPGVGGSRTSETVLLVSPRRLTEMPTGQRIGFSLEDRKSYVDRLGKVRLTDGDVVEVPRLSDVVHVLGAVQSPGPVFYQSGRSAQEYLRQAGGVARDADVPRAVVIKVSGAVQPLEGTKTIDRGDVIVVGSKYQVFQPPRRRTFGGSLAEILGVGFVLRGLR